MKIKLNSGIEVLVEAFHLMSTYGGLLVGSPTIQSNEILISHLSYPKGWGERPFILKKSDMFSDVKNVLKPIVYSVWLSSSDTIDDKENQFDGCALIVMWFGNDEPHKTIHDIILDGVENLDWNKFAENYQF
jgi:hypothetical protein